MRKILSTLLLLVAVLSITAQDAVTVEITGGISTDATRRRIEQQTAKLLTAINKAERASSAINYTGVEIDNLAQATLNRSWDQARFRTEDPDVVTFVTTLKKKNGVVRGYQLRNIGVEMSSKSTNYDGEPRQEIVIDFSPTGRITDFNFTMPTHVYASLVKVGEQLDDLDQRLQIIHWCEQFAKAYRDKNRDFMEAIFSDDALIITGKLMMTRQSGEMGMADGAKVEYVKQNKRQYLSNLYKIFQTQPYVNVEFDDYRIVRHRSKPQYYGVTLTQKWATKSYQDLGTVFLVWDFSDEDAPKIHVRTWQPMSEKAFQLNDFKLP
ncbi:MAG: hypothetical protein LUC85_02820 [Bacteroidales bacterium]|nr:hypothetical protein [Bacteroidales bacterium]MCD8393749.1 hypothetical protein [Bacteroidales bacterium]